MPVLLRTLALCLLVPTAAAQPVPCVDGFAGDYPCRDVDLLARLPLNATPVFAESSSDIWGWTDPVTGTEYAIINQYDHTAFVDLSDPTAPVVIGTLAAPSEDVARDAKVYRDHAFLTTDDPGSGMQVFDLRRLREIQSPPVPFEADAYYTDGTGTHNFAIDTASGFAYLVGSNDPCSGLHIVDLSDPLTPTAAGCYADLGYIHDAQCLTYDGPDADHAGRELCFTSAPDLGRLAIVDVTDKTNPTLISDEPYPNHEYTHQGWLTDDRRYFLLNDEFDESTGGNGVVQTRTLVFDVADLDEPEFVFEYSGPATSTDHNLFVHAGHAFQANYRSGLRVVDLAGIEGGSLAEVAFFDTHPESDATGFDGAFGVYPYFESGIVVVSDMSRGLFVLQPRLGGAVDAETGALPDASFDLAVYPNPFSERTTLILTAARTQRVAVAVYDVLGRSVAHVFDGLVNGDEERRFAFDAEALPAGAYFVRAEGETASVTRSVSLAR